MESRIQLAAQTEVEASLRRIGQHPFIVGARARTLTQEQAERWVKCAGRESRSFPSIIENMIERSTNARIKTILQANLSDEYGNGIPEQAHFMHYVHLLDKVGITREAFLEYQERAGIQLALSLAYNIAMSNNEAVALGYMVVNEGMTGLIYAAVEQAIRHYHPHVRTQFFALHTTIDERHVEELYAAIGELADSKERDALFGIAVGERGMAVLLDEAFGLFDACPDIPSYAIDVPLGTTTRTS